MADKLKSISYLVESSELSQNHFLRGSFYQKELIAKSPSFSRKSARFRYSVFKLTNVQLAPLAHSCVNYLYCIAEVLYLETSNRNVLADAMRPRHICDFARSFEARATTKYSIRAQLSCEFVIGRPYKYFNQATPCLTNSNRLARFKS